MRLELCLVITATIIALTMAGEAPAQETQPFESMDLFVAGQGGYHTYRIPAMVVAKDGTVLAFCEGRKKSRSDAGDIDLLLRRSSDNGKTWTPIAIVHEEGGEEEITIGNPCPVVDQSNGTIWLSFTRNNMRAFMTHSTDNGKTWAAPVEISEALKAFPFAWTRLGTGPVNGIQMRSGRLVMPVWLNDKKGGDYRSAVIHSDDHGTTWEAGGIVPPTLKGCNECTVAEIEEGVLCINVRNKEDAKRRGVAISKDGGLTWSEPVLDHVLFDPVCQASLLQCELGGKPYLVFSNAAHVKRQRLTVRASTDQGKTWSEGLVLQEGPAAYSCLTQLPNGRLACLYEAGTSSPYDRLVFSTFSVDALAPKKSAAKLTEPGVVFTFDDTHIDNWVAAMPIFEKHNAHGTFFVSHFDSLTEEQVAGLRKLREAGHAIGCHGLHHQKPCEYVAKHGMRKYLADDVTPAVNLMLGAGFRPTSFAYPCSDNDDATDAALLRIFRHLRSGAYPPKGQSLAELDGIYTPLGQVADRGCLYGRSLDGTGETGYALDQIREAFTRAKERNELIVLYDHDIGAKSRLHITPESLDKVLTIMKEVGLKSYTYDDLP